MADSTDYEELKWAWKGFRDEIGVANKPHYIRYVELANEVAVANGEFCNDLYGIITNLIKLFNGQL